jgi:hypothetical protein
MTDDIEFFDPKGTYVGAAESSVRLQKGDRVRLLERGTGQASEWKVRNVIYVARSGRMVQSVELVPA